MTRGALETVVEFRGVIAVLHLTGELTSLSEKAMTSTYHALEFDGSPRLVIDFGGTRYINSAGIAVLVSLVADVTRRKGALKFAGLQPHYQRVMEIVGITNYVTLHDEVDQAVAAIAEA
jgi:anti-sigma B factor antagonist